MGKPSVEEKYPLNHPDGKWEDYLSCAIAQMLHGPNDIARSISSHHVSKTPERVVKAYKEIFAGCSESPETALNTVFESSVDQMIHSKDITFYSMCAHHLLPFFGTASFAYIPNGNIVGLSKIPRLIEVFARRPQVQEALTEQIVTSFQRIVQPLGCGLVMRAYHMCCMSRGIRQPTSYTETTDLIGNFRDAAVKQEFLQSVASSNAVWR